MRVFFKSLLILSSLNICFSQGDIYQNEEQIKSEWKGYSTFQKDEMISFCDFLFKEGHYERCLLTLFQILYKFSDDKLLSSTVNYYIGRCYEEIQSYDLALKYYRRVNSGNNDELLSKASNYRYQYVNLISDSVDQVLNDTKNSDDPYMMTFRGYAYLKKFDWENARATFISAQENFKHQHYDDLLTPIFQLIENVNNVDSYNKYLVFLSSAFIPGGGQFLLKEWGNGQGILSSVLLLLLASNWALEERVNGSSRLVENYSTSLPLMRSFNGDNNSFNLKKTDKMPQKILVTHSNSRYILMPLVVSAGIFISSSINSFRDTKAKNNKLLEYFLNDNLEILNPKYFLDFPEPQLMNTRF